MPMPQPNFVPVKPIRTATTHNNGVSSSASTVTARPLMWNEVMFSLRQGSLGCAVLAADRRDLRGEVRPGRKARARAPQVRSDARDVGIAERPAEGRHDDAR